MDRVFVWPPNENLDIPANYVGVMIEKRPDGGFHTGVLYCTSQRGAHVLHLLGHLGGTQRRRFINENPQPSQLCVLCNVDPVEIRALARVFREIYNKNSNSGLPYGFTSSASQWFDDDKLLVQVPLGDGLCCQTFVLAAFQAANMPLIDPAEAPTRIDDYELQREFFDNIIRVAIQNAKPKTQEHFAVVETKLGAAIYRPLEVVGAAKSDALPCSFAEAQANGNDLEPLIPPTVILGMAAEVATADTAVALADATPGGSGVMPD